MGLRLDQLPAKLRDQALEAAGKPKKKRTTQRGQSTRTDGRCACGEPYTSTTAWERHSDALGRGHRRFVLIPREAG